MNMGIQPLGNEDICQEHHGHFSEGMMINRWKEWVPHVYILNLGRQPPN